MSQSIIRYRTKPDQADANAELVRAVYAELNRTRPDGFRYTTLRLDDQVTFVHIAKSERDPSPSSRSRRSASSRPASGTAATSPPSRRPSPRSVPTASSPASRLYRDGDDLLHTAGFRPKAA